MKPVHQVLFAAGLLILGAITWRILTLPKLQANWLTVEAPNRATPGGTITIRVTLAHPDDTLLLTADLHGWTSRNHPLGAISHANPRRFDASVSAMDISLVVPALPDLSTVRAIIYLSPTGNWPDHVRVANSREIPVESSVGAISRELESLPVHELVPDPAIPRLESIFLRYAIVGLWLVVGFVLGLQMKRSRPDTVAASKPRVKAATFALIIACLAAVFVEILGAEQSVGDFARLFAQRHGLYEERHFPQQIAVLLTVVGVAAVIMLVIYRARRRRLVCGLLVYAVVSITATLSLHETDVLLYATILGQPVEQLAKLIAVGISLWGLRPQGKASAVA